MGKGYTPTLAEQGIELPSNAELRPGMKGYYERTGVQPFVDAKTGKRGFVNAAGQNIDEGALPLLTMNAATSFREQALADLRSSRKPNQPVLDALLGRGLERAFRPPEEARNDRVTLDQLAWTNKNLGARGTNGIGGRAMTALTQQLDREAEERRGGQSTALALTLKAQEAQDNGDLERAKHLNNVALELIREGGATERTRITASGREGVAELNAAAKGETAAESAKSKRETAAIAAAEKRRALATSMLEKAYEVEAKAYLGVGTPPSMEDIFKKNPKFARDAGYEPEAPAAGTSGVPKVGDIVVKLIDGKEIRVQVVAVDANGKASYDDVKE
jgi:hypothetical protein